MRPFERVYTMTDFYDGPRAGIADFDGRPHQYTSCFNDAAGYTDVFELQPVDDETLTLALEDWEIWLRWQRAFQAGEATVDTHPALPSERARHSEITQLLTARLGALRGPVVLATATFRSGPGDDGTLEVQWAVEPRS